MAIVPGTRPVKDAPARKPVPLPTKAFGQALQFRQERHEKALAQRDKIDQLLSNISTLPEGTEAGRQAQEKIRQKRQRIEERINAAADSGDFSMAVDEVRRIATDVATDPEIQGIQQAAKQYQEYQEQLQERASDPESAVTPEHANILSQLALRRSTPTQFSGITPSIIQEESVAEDILDQQDFTYEQDKIVRQGNDRITKTVEVFDFDAAKNNIASSLKRNDRVMSSLRERFQVGKAAGTVGEDMTFNDYANQRIENIATNVANRKRSRRESLSGVGDIDTDSGDEDQSQSQGLIASGRFTVDKNPTESLVGSLADRGFWDDLMGENPTPRDLVNIGNEVRADVASTLREQVSSLQASQSEVMLQRPDGSTERVTPENAGEVAEEISSTDARLRLQTPEGQIRDVPWVDKLNADARQISTERETVDSILQTAESELPEGVQISSSGEIVANQDYIARQTQKLSNAVITPQERKEEGTPETAVATFRKSELPAPVRDNLPGEEVIHMSFDDANKLYNLKESARRIQEQGPIAEGRGISLERFRTQVGKTIKNEAERVAESEKEVGKELQFFPLDVSGQDAENIRGAIRQGLGGSADFQVAHVVDPDWRGEGKEEMRRKIQTEGRFVPQMYTIDDEGDPILRVKGVVEQEDGTERTIANFHVKGEPARFAVRSKMGRNPQGFTGDMKDLIFNVMPGDTSGDESQVISEQTINAAGLNDFGIEGYEPIQEMEVTRREVGDGNDRYVLESNISGQEFTYQADNPTELVQQGFSELSNAALNDVRDNKLPQIASNISEEIGGNASDIEETLKERVNNLAQQTSIPNAIQTAIEGYIMNSEKVANSTTPPSELIRRVTSTNGR